MKRLRRWHSKAKGAFWASLDPAGFGLIVYATYQWQSHLGIVLAGLVLIGYGAMRGKKGS